MEISFNGKTVLVTGAGRGFGRQIAIQLVRCGADVIALSRTKVHLDSLVAEYPTIRTIHQDIKDWDATRAAVEAVGPIHALVNNAGTGILQSFFDATQYNFDSTFDINVKAAINISQVVAKGMIERKEGGSIVNLSSICGKAALPGLLVYCASKGALEMVTQVMALELGPHNIRVNSVNPTVVLTDMTRSVWSDPQRAEWLLSRTPMKRFAEVHEVVDAVLYLLSDRASMINGVYLPVDGGMLAC